MGCSEIGSFYMYSQQRRTRRVAWEDAAIGKVPFNRKLTNYQHDFANIENLIFSAFPTA